MKIAKSVFATVLVIIMFLVPTCFAANDAIVYNAAIEKLRQYKDVDEVRAAMDGFSSITSDYGQSSLFLAYAQAICDMNEAKWDTAEKVLELLGSDASFEAILLEKDLPSCKKLLTYSQARQKEEDGDYGTAVSLYKEVLDFWDSISRVLSLEEKTGEITLAPTTVPSPPATEAIPEATPQAVKEHMETESALKSDVLYDNYFDTTSDNYVAPTVFGTKYLREDISTITFYDDIQEAASDAWDVSSKGDRSVMAWVKPNGDMYDLCIAGNGMIQAPKDSRLLFAYYKNVSAIDFNGCFDTSQVTEMNGMFEACEHLASIDVTGFRTSNVLNMSWMFRGCSSLRTLDVTEFDTSKVTTMARMFSECSNLTSLDLSNFNTQRVEHMSRMFYYCGKLHSLYRGPDFIIGSNTTVEEMFTGCPAED